MNEINLLPERYKNKAALMKHIKKTVCVTAVIFLLLMLGSLLLSVFTDARAEELAGLNVLIDDEKYILSDSVYYELMRAEESTKDESAEQTRAPQYDIARLILWITDHLQDDVHAAEFSLYTDDGRVSFTGTAGELDDITAFIALLGERYTDVSLSRLTRLPDGHSRFTAEFIADYQVKDD